MLTPEPIHVPWYGMFVATPAERWRSGVTFGIALFASYRATQGYYIRTSRELARLESISRTPIYALFSETLDGLSTVRAFRMEAQLTSKSDQLLDDNQRAYFLQFSSNCWLGFGLEMVGTLIVVGALLLAVLGRPVGGTVADGGAGKGTSAETYAGLAGLAISMTLNITQSIAWSAWLVIWSRK